MYKAEETVSGFIFKSNNILKLADYVIENPSVNYQFYIRYKPYRNHEFLKKFLQETKDYTIHSKLSASIHEPKSIIDYARSKI